MISGRTSTGGIINVHAQLQQSAVAGEEVEAGAGDLGAALHIDQTQGFAELQVILGLEVELTGGAHVLEDNEVILATGGSAVLHHVGQLHLEVVDILLGGGQHGLQLLDALSLGLAFFAQALFVLVRGRAHLLAHLLAEGFLLGASSISSGNGIAAAHVCLEKLIHQPLVFSAGALRGADQVRVVTQELKIDHVP